MADVAVHTTITDRVAVLTLSHPARRNALNIALQKFEGAVPVIIAEGKDSDGLYFYSKNEEAALRLTTI